MQKITIQLTDEQLERIGYANPWVSVVESLPSERGAQFEVCDSKGHVSIVSIDADGKFPDYVRFWRAIPKPPMKELFELRQQKLEL